MITCGIDIGKGKHAVAVIDESGRQLVRTRFYDNTKAGAERMLAELLRHAEPSQIHVGMESTGNYWRAYYDFLKGRECVVDVINPIVTSASSAGDIRGRKTDKRDAESIAEVVLRGREAASRQSGRGGLRRVRVPVRGSLRRTGACRSVEVSDGKPSGASQEVLACEDRAGQHARQGRGRGGVAPDRRGQGQHQPVLRNHRRARTVRHLLDPNDWSKRGTTANCRKPRSGDLGFLQS